MQQFPIYNMYIIPIIFFFLDNHKTHLILKILLKIFVLYSFMAFKVSMKIYIK